MTMTGALAHRDPVERSYLRGALVAIGGLARVYRSYRRRDGRRVAIKVLAPDRGESRRNRAYMFNEARALRVATNPLVVGLLDHGLSGERPFLVLEWLDGPTLGDVLSVEAPLPMPRLVAIFRQLLDAIEALHRRGVVHADLKPDNAMLVPRRGGGRTLRLIDLGAASLDGSNARKPHEIVGTPGYLAPEVVVGARVEPRSDVYAAGVLLFEMLTGRSPFPGTVLGDVLELQTGGPTPRPSTLRPTGGVALDAVVAMALAPVPSRRFADVASLRGAFEAAVEGGAAGDDRSDDRSDGIPTSTDDLPTMPWSVESSAG